MLRVDQAGEFGATRIYAGQLAVLPRNSAAAKLVSRMADQEISWSAMRETSLAGAELRGRTASCPA